ncbi:MAG: MbcA/ParS/Xre antitoxin family protein [Acidobacteriota bacterium]|nr:MbcA/ParS/Xre antitoxin family protein [Acidobacteriota bacterium]
MASPVDVDFSSCGRSFREPGKAIHWLCSPTPFLEGKTLLEAAQTDQGYREVEDVLVRIEHGVLG